MQKILIATHNAGKLREFSSMFARTPYELVSLSNVGIDVDVDETGSTYAENATLKAVAYARLSGLPTLADDLGAGGRWSGRRAGCALGAIRGRGRHRRRPHCIPAAKAEQYTQG